MVGLLYGSLLQKCKTKNKNKNEKAQPRQTDRKTGQTIKKEQIDFKIRGKAKWKNGEIVVEDRIGFITHFVS